MEEQEEQQQQQQQTSMSASQASKEKEAIGNLLAKKDGVTLISMKSLNVRSYSEIWSKFSPIRFDLSEQELEEKGIRYKICKSSDGTHMYISKFYVTCNECLKLFVHDTVSKGTSHLSNHLKTCGQLITPKKKVSQGPRPTKEKRKSIVSKQSRNGIDTSQFDEKLVDFLSQSLRPLSIIDDPSFRSLLQESITLGSIYGNVDVDLILNKTEWYEQKLLEKYVEHLSSVKSKVKP